MGHTARPSASGRAILVGSLLFLAVATAVAFGRVFAGTAPTVRLAAAAVLSTLLATLLARLHLLVALLASMAALLFALGALAYPETLWYGIPGPRTLEAITRSLGRLGGDAAREIAPAPPLPSLMTAAMLALWAATTAAHALAVRARSPVLALVPGAVLVAFAGVVTADAPRPLFAALYLAGSFGLLFGSSLDRLATWGRLVERPGRHRLGGGTTGRWARRLGVAGVLVAVAIPGVLPGFGASPLLKMDPESPSGVSINPIVDIRPALLQQPATELFSVQARRPAYWRLLSLDRFDGRTWSSTDVLAEEGEIAVDDDPFSGAPGETATASGELVQRFEIRSLSVPWMPTAYRPLQASFGDADVAARWDAEAAVLAKEGGTNPGDIYTVRSQLVEPTPAQLDRSWKGETLDTYLFGDYVELPPMPAEIRTILERITSGHETPYRQALAIQEHLRSFTYDVAAPAGHGVNDMLFFLEDSRRGYCEQFAGTMAVLLRMLRIPSRVAIGFAPGSPAADGRWIVTSQEAHAWVEAYFPGHGWVAFEPTPARTNPVAQPYLSPGADRPARPLGGASELPRRLRQSDWIHGGRWDRELPRGDAPGGFVSGPTERRRWPLWAALALGAAAVVVALGLGRSAGRRLALASARSPAERVINAFRVFEAAAADVGSGRRRGETLTEYGDRLERDLLRSRDGLGRLTRLSTTAAYSPTPPGAAEVEEAVALARRLIRDVRRRAGIARTAVGAVRPAPPL